MYDWNALWHTHQGYRTGYTAPQDDINNLAAELGAKQIKAAKNRDDIAVYQTEDQFILVGHGDGLQILSLTRHTLFDINIRFVSQDEGHTPPPYLEVLVSNPATKEQEAWRGALRRDNEGHVLLENHLLSEGIMPAMDFDGLSFTNHAHFRDVLYSAWQKALPRLLPEIEAWQPEADRGQVRQARYLALIKHEQALLTRLFSDDERQFIAKALAKHKLEDPSACRGLWLKIEANLMEADPDLNIEPLLDKMRKLSFAQELALIESL